MSSEVLRNWEVTIRCWISRRRRICGRAVPFTEVRRGLSRRMEGRGVRTTLVGWRRAMIRDGIPVRMEGTTRRILIVGTRAMIWRGRTRCRNRSRRSNSGIVLQVNRQVMGEVEGRDGCRMTRMGFKRFRCSIYSGVILVFALFEKHEVEIPVDWAI